MEAGQNDAAMNAAQQAEHVVTEGLNVVTEKVSAAALKSGNFEIFGVAVWETLIICLITISIYNLIFHNIAERLINIRESKRKMVIYYINLSSLLVVISFIMGLLINTDVLSLVRVLLAVMVWMGVKYLGRFLDRHFVAWSKKRLGERTVIHNMFKDIIKRMLIVIALLLTFVVLRISVVKFFSMEIPAFFAVFVLVPLLVQMNLLSFLSVINKGFVVGDFIQIGNDSDAISGTCVSVNFSGVVLEMVNGESVILKLARVADADVINISTRRSYRSEKVYYIDVAATADMLRDFFCSVQASACGKKEVELVQCNYITGTCYHHELKVVFDVYVDGITKARNMMDEVHFDIIESIGNMLAVHPCQQQKRNI